MSLKGELYKIPEDNCQKVLGIRAAELLSLRQGRPLQSQAWPPGRRSFAAPC